VTDPEEFPNFFVLDHPLIGHKLTQMRERETPSSDFRRLLQEITALLAYEATRDLPVERRTIETPMARMEAPSLAAGSPVLVSILRAGLVMAEALHDLIPASPEGHIGLRRDEETHRPVEYLISLPDLKGRIVLLADPMLATGNSSIHAIDVLNRHGATDASIRMIALVCAPEGVRTFHAAHPDVPVYTAALDERLDDNAYIVPGLGDAGDRLFNTG